MRLTQPKPCRASVWRGLEHTSETLDRSRIDELLQRICEFSLTP